MVGSNLAKVITDLLNRYLGWVHWAIIILASGLVFVVVTTFLSRLGEPRENIYTTNLPVSSSLAPNSFQSRDFCEAWTGKKSVEVDCRYGVELTTTEFVKGALWHQAWATGILAVERAIAAHETFIASLSPSASKSEILGLINHFSDLTRSWTIEVAKLKSLKSSQIMAEHYQSLFRLTLSAEGARYDPITNEFRLIRWSGARLLDNGAAIKIQAERNERILKTLPFFLCLLTFFLFLIGWYSCRLMGLVLVSFMVVSLVLHFLIIADATVNFGKWTDNFIISPFINQLERQCITVSASLIAFCVCGFYGDKIISVVYRAFWYSRFFLILPPMLSMIAYVLLGPAVGAEILKISLILVVGLITAAFGRSIYLARRYSGSFSLPSFVQLVTEKSRGLADFTPEEVIGLHLWSPLQQIVLFGLLAILIAALFFHDLGATVLALCTSMFGVFMLFGVVVSVLYLCLVAILGLVITVLSVKVQDRIALMVDPMNAPVNDFARLISFGNSGDSNNWFPHIPWCNERGVCLPLQALSDYIPTVLESLIGRPYVAAYVFFGLCVLAFASYRAVHTFLTSKGSSRVLASVCFFLNLALMLQILVNFAGNWRFIPLTGVGIPFISIGITSGITACASIGLSLRLLGSRFQDHT